MKKIIFSILAVASLASCMKEQTVSVQQSGKIGFAGTFVENATRADDPSTTTANIEEFYVWGVIDNETGIVFDDERVYKSGSEWTYDETQYWTPAHKYYFSALAGDRTNDQIVIDLAAAADNGMSVDGLGTVTFTNVDGTNDVLYSESERETGAAITSQPEDVKFQFAHLLSKVKFSFKNGFVNQNNSIVVKNIKMTVPQTGVIDLTQDSFVWYDLAGDLVLEMGDMDEAAKVLAGASASSDNERLTIPAAATQEYTVTFDVELYQGAVLASSASKTVKIEGCALEPGKAYNFTAVINEQNVDDNPLFPITFDAEVNEWDTEVVYDGGVLTDNTHVVYTRDELQAVLDAAYAAGENVKAIFGADINGNVTVYELPDLTTTINGNGKKFNGYFRIQGDSRYENATTVFENINFVNDDATKLKESAFIYSNEDDKNDNSDNYLRYPDNVTIRNCTFKATGAAEKLAVGAKFWSLNGKLIVEDTQANGMHSLVQLTSCGETDATFNNITIENCKNGLSFQNNKATITNSTIKTTEYGIRANGSASTVSIEKSTIEAKQPVIVRKVTVDGFVLNVDDATVLTPSTADDYAVIFTTGSDDAAYVAPTVEYTCNVPMKHKVFPRPEGWVRTAADFAEELKADKENISVTLINNIDVAITALGDQTAGSGEYKLGSENTKNITIDLNGKNLNITTTYWSALGAKNADALFTIKNGSMTSTGNSAGTWNAWDLRFSNCNYAFEDVVFNKAVALDNVGKSTVMKGVTITDTHDTDTYGLWITAEGQTVTLEDCVIDMTPAADGRGIKIDNQYVDAADQKMVTLNVKNVTFNTDEKAAILVKNPAGAVINIDGINITGVKEDTEFAVWVDEDAAAYADKVVVTGALKRVEGGTSARATSSDEIATAINNGATAIVLTPGTYVVPAAAKGKTVAFVGSGNPEDVKVAVTKVGTGGENCDYGLDGSNATFENITITTNSSTYIGYARCNGTYKNCIINGTYTLYGKSVFEDCTFNVSGDVYNIWTWGAPTATFNNCTFNSDGKALLLYGMNNTKLTVNNCTFKDNGGLADLKAAIEIGNDYGTSYELIVNNTHVYGYEINDKGINTGTTLWANKNSMPQDKLNVVVDGVDVY